MDWIKIKMKSKKCPISAVKLHWNECKASFKNENILELNAIISFLGFLQTIKINTFVKFERKMLLHSLPFQIENVDFCNKIQKNYCNIPWSQSDYTM